MFKEIKTVIYKNPPGHDHDDVRFNISGEIRGFGFLPKEGDKTIGLIKCPDWERENYVMSVVIGLCAY